MANEYKSLINSSLLSYYNDKAKQRELNKINKLPFKNKSEFLKLYFAANRDEKIYGVKFAYDANDVIQASSGVKYGANANLVVEPSTRTVAGRDDYRNINVFKSIDANVHYEPDGELVVDAIEGDPEFSYYGKVDVVCIFAPVYERIYDEEETVNGVTTKWWHIEWTDTPRDGFTLNILCKDIHGKNRGWYCITKFQAGMIDNVLYASAGLHPYEINYESIIEKYHSKSLYLSSITLSQFVIIQRIFLMKYSRTNFQSVFTTLTSYNKSNSQLQTNIDNKNFIIIPASDADAYQLNTIISVGISSGTGYRTEESRSIIDNTEILSKDTNIVVFKDINSGLNITDTNIVIVTQIPNIAVTKTTDTSSDLVDIIVNQDEDIPVEYTNDGVNATGSIKLVYDGTNYNLIIVDANDNTIATSTNGDTACVAIYISDYISATTNHSCETAIYNTGYSLEILGKDGNHVIGQTAYGYYSHPCVLSGIELFQGCIDIIGNAINRVNDGKLNYGDGLLHNIYMQNDLTKLSDTNTYIMAASFELPTDGFVYAKNVDYNLINGSLLIKASSKSLGNGLCDSVYSIKNTVFRSVGIWGYMSNGTNYGPFHMSLNSITNSTDWRWFSRPAFGCCILSNSE